MRVPSIYKPIYGRGPSECNGFPRFYSNEGRRNEFISDGLKKLNILKLILATASLLLAANFDFPTNIVGHLNSEGNKIFFY